MLVFLQSFVSLNLWLNLLLKVGDALKATLP